MRKAQKIIKGLTILDNYDIEIGGNGKEEIVVSGAADTNKEDHKALRELGWVWSEATQNYTFIMGEC